MGLIALAAAASAGPAYPLGMGEPLSMAALGQPMAISIPLRASGPEGPLLAARLIRMSTPVDLISDQGTLERLFRTSVILDSQGSPQVLVKSLSRVTEPYLEFTIEVSAGDTRLQRDFTVLVDPPGYEVSDPPPATVPQAPVLVAEAPATAPAPVARAAPAPRLEPDRVVAQAPRPAPVTVAAVTPPPRLEMSQAMAAVPVDQVAPIPRAQAPKREGVRKPIREQLREPVMVASLDATPGIESGTESYRVQPGDCLSSIAGKLARLTGGDSAELAARIYRDNPQAFRGSPDFLLAGANLELPSDPDADLHMAAVEAEPVIETPVPATEPVVEQPPATEGVSAAPLALAMEREMSVPDLMPISNAQAMPVAAPLLPAVPVVSVSGSDNVIMASMLSSILTALFMLAGFLILGPRSRRA